MGSINYGSLLSNGCIGMMLLNRKCSESADISEPWVGCPVCRASTMEETKTACLCILGNIAL